MPGPLHPLDWTFLVLYFAFSIWVGARFSKRAGQNPEEYFLAGRRLPWWVAGTSMVATSFAADTPLVVSGWARESGIWKNWAWWCFAISGALHAFAFSRWWRRGEVMTKAELVELRYGPRARFLRGFLGVLNALVVNTIIMGWVLLAAMKILGVLLGIDPLAALVTACAIALTYSWFAGFWGVVVTDLVQFAMAMLGAVSLGWLAWREVGGRAGLEAHSALRPESLAFVPHPGTGSPLEAGFWTVSFAAFCVYLGISWWAVESVDGSGTAVQRISAARTERDGLKAVLWFDVAHYALRPWCWILVGLASLALLPRWEVPSPVSGTVVEAASESIRIAPDDGANPVEVSLRPEGSAEDWHPRPRVGPGDPVAAGEVVARTDPERAYVVLARRLLPVGWLGLVAASLMAAFMSTIDTHANLAASFFVNDVYRRFLVPHATPRHYVTMARLATVLAVGLAALFAWQADSIGELFFFFFALLGGVGPIYLLRWVWWRITPGVEVAAMIASALTTLALTVIELPWPESPLSPGGRLAPEGRLIAVVAASLASAGIALLWVRPPDPRELLPFYRRVRPLGWWGPVRRLAPDLAPAREGLAIAAGVAGTLALVYGATLGAGLWFLERGRGAGIAGGVAVAGALTCAWALGRLRTVPSRAGSGRESGAGPPGASLT